MSDIHPTAVIESGAKIGRNLKIGPFSSIGPNVVLGDDNVIGANVRIEGYTTIGNNNHFYHSAVIGSVCQDLKYKGEPTKLIIGNHNRIREYVTINTSATMDEDTTIGDNCYLMAYCHIAHNCHLGNNIIMANVATLAGHINIEDFVTIGGLTAVHQFVKIGKYAFVGGVSGVKKDVPPFTRGEGMPFRPIGLNTVGLERKGFSYAAINAIKDIYRVFYNPKYNVTQALDVADKMTDLTPEQEYFIDFVRNSQRGIAK
ncbi:MAG: acyl-ACP--UDP-N-acetylglucosamine O-acyltransferase [Candidatus Cloacimonetes bacterium]|nr:acyl-ACP--UDP-N-acetylglucosamine O-acyltransferase [Candidatus Cloacimonadota bacterium]